VLIPRRVLFSCFILPKWFWRPESEIVRLCLLQPGIGSMIGKFNDSRISNWRVSVESEHVETKQTSTMTDLTRTDEVCRPTRRVGFSCSRPGRRGGRSRAVQPDNCHCPKRSDPSVSVTFDWIISIVGSPSFLEHRDVLATDCATPNVTRPIATKSKLYGPLYFDLL